MMLERLGGRYHCNDGFNVSVVWGYGTYSDPDSYELGFPSSGDSLITPYAEDPENLTGTVYGYVPSEIVQQLFEKHGGLADNTQYPEI